MFATHLYLGPPTTTTTRAPCQVRTTDGNVTTTNYPNYYNSNEDWCVIIQGNVSMMNLRYSTITVHLQITCCRLENDLLIKNLLDSQKCFCPQT